VEELDAAADDAAVTDAGMDTDDAALADAAVDSGEPDASKPSTGGLLEGCPLTPPTACPEPTPHYADVEPIFEAHCWHCHDGQHGLWSLMGYQHVADWFGEIRTNMIGCTMPPPGDRTEPAITATERMRILEWIRCDLPK
jgi:hypothetical protein